MPFYIGCAGWSLRQEFAAEFPSAGTHLERYAGRLSAVEINSSFYRLHRRTTYERWAASTPLDFRFSMKLPRQITHERRLIDSLPLIEQFAGETAGLGNKRGPILVQLPPSLAFDGAIVDPFFRKLREQIAGSIVCEPRHRSWFGPEADELLQSYSIARVAADPSVVPEASRPGGCRSLSYFRWHGSPRIYYSAYEQRALVELAESLQRASEKAADVWCIFDNTAEGAATRNAIEIVEMLRRTI